MTSEKNSKIRNSTMLLFSIFYIAIGILEIGYFVIENLIAPVHIPILGILSLITAYFIFKMKKLALPLVVGLLVLGITFGITTLYNSIILQTFGGAILFHLVLIIYMIALLIISVFILTKRKKFN
jgi:hypothetical protein